MKFRGAKVFAFCVFCLTVLMHASVFAQQATPPDCSSICNVPASQLTLMLDMARELTNAIKTQWTAGDYIGKYVSPNRFEWNTFTPPKQGLADKLATNISQKLNFVAATTAIFTSPQQWWGVTDIFAGILALFKNGVFMRDLQSVQKMDALLTQKKYELGLWWGWFETISPTNVKVFQSILQSYKTKWLLTGSYAISSDTTYQNMTFFIERLLIAMKTFLSVNPYLQRGCQYYEWSRHYLFSMHSILFSENSISPRKDFYL